MLAVRTKASLPGKLLQIICAKNDSCCNRGEPTMALLSNWIRM